MKIVYTILFVYTFAPFIFGQNYSVGDTLNVVALNGLNLRETNQLNGSKITLLENGEKVIVLSIDKCLQDSIDGFLGCWVRIHSLSDGYEGFAFDAYLSHYPILKEMESLRDFTSGKYQWRDDEHYSYMPRLLEEYVSRVFKQHECKAEYFNGVDGEAAHSFEITILNQEVSMIKHGYWEGSSTELQLTNARVSEAYYLILNLTKFLPPEIFKINEERIKIPNYQDECVGKGETGCIIRIFKKSNNIISIFFHDTCC